MTINIAIIGVGNCASALYQALHFYSSTVNMGNGLMKRDIGGYLCNDIKVVAAFDIDKRNQELLILFGITFSSSFLLKLVLSGDFMKGGSKVEKVLTHSTRAPF